MFDWILGFSVEIYVHRVLGATQAFAIGILQHHQDPYQSLLDHYLGDKYPDHSPAIFIRWKSGATGSPMTVVGETFGISTYSVKPWHMPIPKCPSCKQSSLKSVDKPKDPLARAFWNCPCCHGGNKKVWVTYRPKYVELIKGSPNGIRFPFPTPDFPPGWLQEVQQGESVMPVDGTVIPQDVMERIKSSKRPESSGSRHHQSTVSQDKKPKRKYEDSKGQESVESKGSHASKRPNRT